MALFFSVMLVAMFHGRLVKAELSAMGWSKIYVGTGMDKPHALVQTVDGGYALAGYTSFFGFNNRGDFWLGKTDANGNAQWNKTYGEEQTMMGQEL